MLTQKFENINPFPQATFNTTSTIGDIITAIIPYLFAVSGIVLLLMLLSGGFSLMFAAGDPKKIAGAWGRITNAAIGFVIIFVAFWLTQLIGQVLNISIFGSIFK